MPLSVAIVSLNEEVNLGRTLESVKWADEIVVVDSGSTDRTCEIARQYGAKVVVEPWRGYAAQKNFAIEHCTQTWVLSLDADEQISPALAQEMRDVLSDPNALDGYRVPRLNLFLGRALRHGGFYPDPKLRLFRRGMGFVTGRDPHDRVELKGVPKNRIGRFRNPMIHYTYPSLYYYLEHMNRYSTVWNEVEGAKAQAFSVNAIVLRPLATFVYNYFFRLGFLDGREGLLLHLYHAGYVSWKYAKAWELSRKPPQ
ncbi:MAG: glycosyltransferase family 2 protein [Candidatus Sulfotelmatobacter sp.]